MDMDIAKRQKPSHLLSRQAQPPGQELKSEIQAWVQIQLYHQHMHQDITIRTTKQAVSHNGKRFSVLTLSSKQLKTPTRETRTDLAQHGIPSQTAASGTAKISGAIPLQYSASETTGLRCWEVKSLIIRLCMRRRD